MTMMIRVRGLFQRTKAGRWNTQRAERCFDICFPFPTNWFHPECLFVLQTPAANPGPNGTSLGTVISATSLEWTPMKPNPQRGCQAIETLLPIVGSCRVCSCSRATAPLVGPQTYTSGPETLDWRMAVSSK